MNFGWTGRTQSLQFSSIFRSNLPPEKKNRTLLKTKIYMKTTSLGLSNNINQSLFLELKRLCSIWCCTYYDIVDSRFLRPYNRYLWPNSRYFWLYSRYLCAYIRHLCAYSRYLCPYSRYLCAHNRYLSAHCRYLWVYRRYLRSCS